MSDLSAETTVEVDYVREVIVYRLIPDVARELAQVLLGAGTRTNDGGWLKDAEALLRAAADAEQSA